MAFRDFTFPGVQQTLGLSVVDADMFGAVPPMTLREEFAAQIHDGTELALGIDTEKARSEFIIAPVLLEVRRCLGGSFGIFSGIEFNVDASRGLNGYCDFILTKVPRRYILTGPLVAIAEAKNDNIRNGLGQCIAGMVAAQAFNQMADMNLPAVYGVVTTGSTWKFLRLRESEVTLEIAEYYIVDVTRIMGILAHIVRTA